MRDGGPAGSATLLHVLRVFVAPDGRNGNPLAVFVDGAAAAPPARQRLAARLGFSETVFVDDLNQGSIKIFAPSSELAFAGHPVVGTAWLLTGLGYRRSYLRAAAGEVPIWQEGGMQWIRARLDWIHYIKIEQLASPADVEALSGPPAKEESYYCWAWLNRRRTIRSRYFAPALGVAEDEATGAAAVRLTAELRQPIEIVQGKGSRIYARPGPGGSIEIGGRVVLEATRHFPLPYARRHHEEPHDVSERLA